MLLTPHKAARASRHRNRDSSKEPTSTVPVLQWLSWARQIARAKLHLDLTSRDGSYTPSNVSLSTMTPSLHPSTIGQHRATLRVLAFCVTRSGQSKPRQVWSAIRSSMCAEARSLQQPRVWKSPQLLEGLGYQAMRWSPIGASWPVVHVRAGDGGAVSWTTREESSALCITVPRVCTPIGPVLQAAEQSAMPEVLKIQTSRLAKPTIQEPTTAGHPVGGFSVRMPSVEWLRNRRLVLSRTCMFGPRNDTSYGDLRPGSPLLRVDGNQRSSGCLIQFHCTSATSQLAVNSVPL